VLIVARLRRTGVRKAKDNIEYVDLVGLDRVPEVTRVYQKGFWSHNPSSSILLTIILYQVLRPEVGTFNRDGKTAIDEVCSLFQAVIGFVSLMYSLQSDQYYLRSLHKFGLTLD